MSELDERITRLTELARDVWPRPYHVCIELTDDGSEAEIVGLTEHTTDSLLSVTSADGRAVDAMEGALTALSGAPQKHASDADEAATKLLDSIRANKHFAVLLATLEVDRGDWARDERDNDDSHASDGVPDPFSLEDYAGESRERRELYDQLYELLAGKPYVEPVCVSAPEEDDYEDEDGGEGGPTWQERLYER